MSQLYDRGLRLTVNGEEVVNLNGDPDNALRVKFDIIAASIPSPGKAQIRVYNLSDRHASALIQKNAAIELYAGYNGNIARVFKGTAPQFRKGRENPTDTFLDIFAADGDLAHNYAVVSKSLAKGSTPNDHFDAFLATMQQFGITRGYVPELTSPRSYPRGVSFAGMTRDYLHTLAHSNNCSWSIQQGQLQMVPASGYIPGSAIPINATSGMVGMPEQTIDGVAVRVLINPMILIDHLVHINEADIQKAQLAIDQGGSVDNPENAFVQGSIAADDIYRVCRIDMEGDTRGEPWYMNLLCIAANQAATGPVPQKILQSQLYGEGYF